MTRARLAIALCGAAMIAPSLAEAHSGGVGSLRCHRVAETTAQHCHDAATEQPPHAGSSTEWCDNWRLQQCLALLGYDPGAIDGNYGPKTRSAWRAYADEYERGVETRTCASLTAPDALDCKQ